MNEEQRNLGRVYSECFERKKYHTMWSEIKPQNRGKIKYFRITCTASPTYKGIDLADQSGGILR
jgi:hypothetical protein